MLASLRLLFALCSFLLLVSNNQLVSLSLVFVMVEFSIIDHLPKLFVARLVWKQMWFVIARLLGCLGCALSLTPIHAFQSNCCVFTIISLVLESECILCVAW